MSPFFSPCTADCSPALQDSNCDECGFDSNGTAICTMCREDYRVVDGQCHGRTLYFVFRKLLLIFCLSFYMCACTHTHTHMYTHTVCPLLSLDNGNVMYSPTNRGVGSVATHTCNTGYRLSPQGGETRTCNSNISWDGQNVTCGKYTLPLASSPGPSLRGRRAWYTPTAHAPVCTQNLGTSYIPVKYSVNYLFTIMSSSQSPRI